MPSGGCKDTLFCTARGATLVRNLRWDVKDLFLLDVSPDCSDVLDAQVCIQKAGTSKNIHRLTNLSTMPNSPRKSRDLDHLMEQNSTELDFLSAYGGSSSEGDGEAIFAALQRFLKAGGVQTKLNRKKDTVAFSFGKAKCEPNGCEISFEGANLPLVASDLLQSGFTRGVLDDNRMKGSVVMTEWGLEQRRFIERLVEYFTHVE